MLIRRAAFFAVCLTLFLGCAFAWDQKKDNASYTIEKIDGRKVYLAMPKGDCPEKGWQVAILLHGRGQTPGVWFGEGLLAQGDQKLFPPLILESGLVVMAPEALEPFEKGIRQWDFFHKILPNSKDLTFFNALFQWMQGNRDIKFDLSKIYVIGISSGGFMASRLAQVFPENWEGIVVIAAGNADSFPRIPSFPIDNNPLSHKLSSEHPPTLIIHGDKDRIIPFAYGERYYQDLKQAGVNTEMLVMTNEGHRWPAQFHENIIQWLQARHKSGLITGDKKDNLILDESCDGKTVFLAAGETFSLGLKGVPTAGYVWKIVEIDDKMINKLDEGQKSLAKPGLVGGSAQFFWRFQAIGKGKTRLILKYFRPWEGAEKASKTLTVDLTIQ
jgi:predicted esterase/predicted secreted protein